MAHPVIVLGAGMAGLAAARELGAACEVYEKELYVGGHCHTKRVNGFNFDEGAHVFFGKDDCSRRFVWEPLGDEMVAHTAEIWNNYGERRYGPYPVQVNAHALPPDLAVRSVMDFIEASGKPAPSVRTYEEWCHGSLGKTFAEKFLLRYARKFWTVDPSELTTDWLGSSVGGRITRPSIEQVIRGAIETTPQRVNYLTDFWYPVHGGFGRIVEPLASRVPNVRLGCAVTRIESSERRLTFANGTVREYEAVVSTIPLPELVKVTIDAPIEVRYAADELMWTSIRCVNVGVARPNVGRGHWAYFYDEAVPFFRISFPSKYSPNNAPAGHSSISCEVSYSRRRPLSGGDLKGRVINALRSTGVIEETDHIVVEDEIDIPYAYVVYDSKRAQSVETIHSWMESVGLYPCGRFAEWGYHWSFEAIESGRRVAERVGQRLGLASGV